jgi:3',5'-cyclic AMP phosphodiesterase CpdA
MSLGHQVHKLRRLANAALLLFLPFVVAAQDTKPWYFLQLADTQFGMYAKDANFLQETANAEFVVATANRLKPSFVIVCGDMVNRTGDAAQIAEYKRVMARLDPAVHIYNVPGNHDVGNEPTPAALEAYRSAFGPDWYRFDEGDLTGIVLNGSLIAAPQNAPGEYARQERWLREELSKTREKKPKHLVVFIHQSLFLEAADEADQYFNVPKVRRALYLDLFQQFGVTQVFAGHYHRNAWGKTGNLEMVTTGPVSLPLGKDPSGLRIVRVTTDGLQHRYYGLGTLPNTLQEMTPAILSAGNP